MGHRLTRYVADACALIDFYTGDARLPDRVVRQLQTASSDCTVLATTVWEIAVKARLGRLPNFWAPSNASLGSMLRQDGFALVAFDDQLAEQAAGLPPLHRDPFDRALVAAAQRLGATILTSDAMIARYGVPVSW